MALITGNWITDIFYMVVALLTAFYIFAIHTYGYWERRNFKTLPNVNYLMGHFRKIFFREQSFAALMLDLYNQTTEPFIGLYSTFRPILFIRDPELIQSILVKDFNHFVNRGIYCNEIDDPLSGHLFSLQGQKWRKLRGNLSPTFTSVKLKTMFSTFLAAGAPLQKHLDKIAEKGEPIDIRDLAACYTTNNIASVAFGIEVDTIADPNDDFRKFGKRIFEPTIWNTIRGAIAFTAPKLMDFFSIRLTDPDVEEFIFSIVKQNLEYREKYNVTRKDFFQQLIQLVKSGTAQLDDQWETEIESDENQKKMTIDEMAAQVFVFFVAGYETSATSLAYCLLELAKQPELQKRVQIEIDCVLDKYNGEITYESLSEMKFMGNCLDETLRLHPIPFLNRSCLNDYRIPGTENVIEKGVQIFIPVIGLHHNEKYYPEPLKFKPERFSDEELVGTNQINRPYLPFGDGPRNCIGIRMGIVQVKIGLVSMLQQFTFTLVSEEDHKNLTDFDPKSFIPLPKKGIHLNVIKRSEFN